MRTSYRPDFIADDGVLTGFYFDNGGCAEHEIGIDPLRRDFGMSNLKLGVERRTMTHTPYGLIYAKFKQNKIPRAVLMYRCGGFHNAEGDIDPADVKAIRKYITDNHLFQTRPYKDGETSWISCGWSDRDFGIYVAGAENVEALDKIATAMRNYDVMMYVGNPTPENPFSRGGLIFMIVSTLPDDFKEAMYDSDYDAKMLTEKAQPYIDMARKAGLKFHALSPRWANEEKTELRFWLNPWDQQNNYFGWITVGDLLDWVKGKGIVPGHGFRFEREHPEAYKNLTHNEKHFVV